MAALTLKNSYTFTEINLMSKELSLDEKIEISCAVISEALIKCKHTAAIAFSGGKDSEVVADLIERFFPTAFDQIHCIFGNTGIEFPESLKFARKYGKEHFGDRFHETELLRTKEDELRYDFAHYLVAELEEEGALDEILKPDGKLKGQKALIDAARKRDYDLDHTRMFPKGTRMTFAYCVEQYGAPLLGKAASKLDAHRINIECFLKYSKTASEDEKLKGYYETLKKCKFSQHCCKLLKKEPSERLQAELDVDVIFKGLMAAESHSRMVNFSSRGHIFESHRKHLGEDSFYHVNPLSLWTDEDVWDYIKRYNIEYSPLYDITYTASDGSIKHIERNGCIMCGTDIQFKDSHLSILRQTHPKAWESCMEHFGYRDQLYELFKDKKSMNILDSFTENGTRARLIDRWGSSKRLFDNMPCAFDEFSELVDLDGTGLNLEYDAETENEDLAQVPLSIKRS